MSGIYGQSFAWMDGPFTMIYGTDLWSFDQELEQIKIYIPSPLPPHEWGSPSSVMSWDVAVTAQFSVVLDQDLEQSQFRKNTGIWVTHKWALGKRFVKGAQEVTRQEMFIQGRRFSEAQAAVPVVIDTSVSPLGRRARTRWGRETTLAMSMFLRQGGRTDPGK